MTSVDSTAAYIETVYRKMATALAIVRQRLARPLTYTEKILYGHLDAPAETELEAGRYIKTRPDRVALQDATAQMAILQFMLAGKDEAAVPVTIHCDHLIRAHRGAGPDLSLARNENREVYDFLTSASQRYGFGCWLPGAGIIHQVILERYAFPGLMMLGTDSHTPNAGGLGAFASGVGGADAVDVMVGMPWEVLHPHIVGVHLKGRLHGWTAPKDIILRLLAVLTCAGGTNRVFEYFGDGVESISATGKSTICNMGAELGATTSLFPFDRRMQLYLQSCGRREAAELAGQHADLLRADPEVLADPTRYFAEVIEIDLDALEPHVVGPHSPDRATTVSGMAAHVAAGGYPEKVSYAMIGSCTNSSYEDMEKIAAMAGQLADRGLRLKTPLLITPGSEQVRATIERDGQLARLEAVGATVLANACGPCIGQWNREGLEKGTKNSIITSYNRNFPKRNDGNPETCCFIASPETCLAYAIHGDFSRDPYTTEIKAADGSTFRLNPPQAVHEVPEAGFVRDVAGFLAPLENGGRTEIKIRPESERLAILDPFPPWSGADFRNLRLLLKARGKCTTDHISPAGPWLRFRGHLDNISNNIFNGAVNAFTGEAGKAVNGINGEIQPYNEIARAYKTAGESWVAVGDTNYGEGSSREHAAMSPRHMGGLAVITRSFARIHETNLKKQGILPLTFTRPEDYDLVQDGDRIDLLGLTELAPGSTVRLVLHHRDGSISDSVLNHSLNAEQIAWFKAGSALNFLRRA
ncbi:aconitate hydratase [Desulfoprunum benzoelyticum]|uniref:Aconitate hydratase A n=1 Tax=Desulfoprunum benzoelyticum TaxID=1506996 RepID=A0A840UTT4_9BACT|nr:aconitate hydratase [Desulfoprunum benzoelyticum]MBB5348163.1 aconitate hydratase [Desulfoprunum benzoelyticum]MBM9530909.1 aconitate hydratase [Desulfoprunum benzoelyticum]